MSERAEALREVVALVRRHGFSTDELIAALGRPLANAQAESHWRSVIVRVLGYLGGTFVFAGIGVFIALQWDSLNSAARVIVTLGPGVSALILALLAVREERFSKATTPLLLVAAAVEPTGMFVAFEEFGSGGDWRWASLITTATLAVQFAAVFGRLRRSTPLFLAAIFATSFLWTALDLLNVDEKVIALVVGASLLLAAVGMDRSGHEDITPLFYFLGAVGFLFGFFDSVKRTPFEITFVAVAAAFVYLATVLRTRTLLFVATLAILAYTGYFTGEHFADSVGWPLALIGFGIFMIALSAAAFRIDRDYVRRAR
jgi:predicted membrane protein DUF2157